MTKPNVAWEWLPENFFLFPQKKQGSRRWWLFTMSTGTGETCSDYCVCCIEHWADHPWLHCPALSSSAGAEPAYREVWVVLSCQGRHPGKDFTHISARPKQSNSWMKSALSYQWPYSPLRMEDSAALLLLPAAWCQRTEPPIRAGRRLQALPWNHSSWGGGGGCCSKEDDSGRQRLRWWQ